jgi:hypothetical protein
MTFIEFVKRIKWGTAIKPTPTWWLWALGFGLLSAISGTKERPVWLNVAYTEAMWLLFNVLMIFIALPLAYQRIKHQRR